MSIFDVEKYNNEKEWRTNSLLVDGDTGIKKCRHCHQRLYAVDFANDLSFPDGKLPVCSPCLRKQDEGLRAWQVLAQYTVKHECSRCKERKYLDQFMLGGRNNTLTKYCRDCEKKKK